jgi:hypothetical protein
LFVTLIILSFKRFIVLNMLCIIQESCWEVFRMLTHMIHIEW